MVMAHLLAFAVALALSLLVTPAAIRLATLIKAVDVPDERKVHRFTTARLGGVAIFFGFFVALFVAINRFPGYSTLPWDSPFTGLILFIAAFAVLLLGVMDDVRQLGPGTKFLAELILTTCVYFAGVRISVISYPFGSGHLELGLMSYPVTVLWIVGIMNALNLIDGLDGLAAGVSIVAALTMSAVSYSLGDTGTAFVALSLAGAVLGFLRYNFHPARIFLGDSGSLFLGFMLGVLSVLGTTKGSTAFAIAIPVLALGLPIMDTLLAMVRRLLRPLLPEQRQSIPLLRVLRSLFMPDRDHIHHRLLALGLSQRSAVLLLYVVSSALGCTAYGLSKVGSVGSSMIFILAMTALMYGVRRLNYREIAIFKNGSLLALFDYPVMQRQTFQVFVDLTCMLVACFLSWLCIVQNVDKSVSGDRLLIYISSAVFIQAVIFWTLGLYKGIFRHASIADALKISKGVIFAVGAVGFIFVAFGDWSPRFTLPLLVMDLFFLLTLTGGWRFSYRILSQLNQPPSDGKKKVLIYGAGPKGAATLQFILNTPALQISPIGFIDDDPALEGKTMCGFPVFGGHWKIQRLINMEGVREIIMATSSLKPEVLKRLVRLSRVDRIQLKSLTLSMEELLVEFKPQPEQAPGMPAAIEKVRPASPWPARVMPGVSWNRS